MSKLKELTDKIGSGATPRGGEQAYKKEGISLIRSQNVLDFDFNYNNLAKIDDKQAKELNNVEVKENDILINITGDSIARVCIVPNDVLPARVNQHVSIVRCNNKIDSNFLLCYLFFLKNYLLTICRVGGTRNALTKEALEKLEIVHNDNVDIQKKLVAVIDVILKKININNKINEELEKLAKTLYEYWFVQFDFPDENNRPYKSSGGKMVYNEILKRDIPANWNIKELQNIASISNEQITPDEGVIYKHYSIPAFDESGTYIMDSGTNIHSNKFVIKSFDVLISKLNPRFSRIICADNEDNMVSSTELIVFRCNDKLNQSLVYCIAKSDNFYLYCVKNATGSSGSHNRINPEIMGAYKIPYNHSIYELFKSRISNIIQKRNLIIKENQKLICIRAFLLPMLMNGQISIIAE